MKKIAILQPDYIPWKGVFDMINMVDCFVFFDDVDFTRRDWRTRNRIKTPNGELWLSVPVKHEERGAKIKDINIMYEDNWQKKHFDAINLNYKKSPHYKEFLPLLSDIYLEKKWINLSELDIYATKKIADILGITTQFICSSELRVTGTKDDRLIEICKKLNANKYLSGPAAKTYIVNDKFKKNDIKLSYIKYSYPEYKQLYSGFTHYVSVLDVLFNCGKDKAKDYIFMNQEEEIL